MTSGLLLYIAYQHGLSMDWIVTLAGIRIFIFILEVIAEVNK